MKSTKMQNPQRSAVVEKNCLVAEYHISYHNIIEPRTIIKLITIRMHTGK